MNKTISLLLCFCIVSFGAFFIGASPVAAVTCNNAFSTTLPMCYTTSSGLNYEAASSFPTSGIPVVTSAHNQTSSYQASVTIPVKVGDTLIMSLECRDPTPLGGSQNCSGGQGLPSDNNSFTGGNTGVWYYANNGGANTTIGNSGTYIEFIGVATHENIVFGASYIGVPSVALQVLDVTNITKSSITTTGTFSGCVNSGITISPGTLGVSGSCSTAHYDTTFSCCMLRTAISQLSFTVASVVSDQTAVGVWNATVGFNLVDNGTMAIFGANTEYGSAVPAVMAPNTKVYSTLVSAGSVSITTTASPAKIGFGVAILGSKTVGSVTDGSGLNWTLVKVEQGNGVRIEYWSATATTLLNGDSVTATLSSGTAKLILLIWGNTNVNRFDPSPNNPGAHTGNDRAPAVAVYTTAFPEITIGIVVVKGNPGITPHLGWTTVATASFSGMSASVIYGEFSSNSFGYVIMDWNLATAAVHAEVGDAYTQS